MELWGHGKVNYPLLKGLYVFTIVVAGFFGLGMLFMPETAKDWFSMPMDNPMIYGVTGSVFLAFALVSILGLRSPLKFVPVLLLQLSYKTIWVVLVAIPALIDNAFPSWAYMTLIIFLIFIIWDLIAIPFWILLEKDETIAKTRAVKSKTKIS
ncbi:MAG: hypothetical protein SA339_10365 [Methanomassiliicoccus sp.]|nr:hypothetical protein [Methanomassiliicoccus sp.]